MSHLLYPYILLSGHPDPLFDEFTFGNVHRRGKQLKARVKKGSYIFFWTMIAGRQYITAYFVVSKVMDTAEARKDRSIMKRYRNPHLHTDPLFENDVLVFGDPKESRKLAIPLRFDRNLAEKLSLGIKFSPDKTEAQNIGSACRQPRVLSEADKDTLFEAIIEANTRGWFPLNIREWNERELEDVLVKNPHFLGEGYQVRGRQVTTPFGRIDLLLEEGKELLVVEIKEGMAPDSALVQVQDYARYVSAKYPQMEVQAAIICAEASPRLERMAKDAGVKIYRYGAKFHLEEM